MDINTKLPKKHFYIIISSLSIIILALSLEVMMTVKDISLYDIWYNDALKEGLLLGYEESFSIYVSTNLSSYIQKLVVPMALGTHTYFAYTKIRISKLFVFIWVVLLIGAASYIGVEMNFASIFYYIEIVTYVVTVITVLSLVDVIDNNKSS